jgi:hypothetical protein
MRRKLVVLSLAIVVVAAVLVAWQTSRTTAEPPKANADVPAPVEPPAPVKPPQPALPVGQVFLFNSGVGYFQREGEVEGNARVDLLFQGTDVNDLLKSLVLQDLGGGKVSAIGYDSHEPIERTLKSFALDLTTNPSFGQLLNQARGEKVEVVLAQSNASQPGTMTGIVVGMESQRQPHGKDAVIDMDVLNLLCLEGVRSIPLSQVVRVRFLNATLDSEFRRALEVLASSHDTMKKMVSLGFSGDGKRPVRVGYVVENPIWKTSYRLLLDGNGKAFLQGWAAVENTSDEDWRDVRMVLVSGRPISFQMNLYEPLYIPRPTVEPDLFASLRPPTYGGALNPANPAVAQGQPGGAGMPPPNMPMGNTNFAPNQLGFGGGFQGGQWGLQGGAGNTPFFNRFQMGNGTGQFGMQGGGQFGQQGGQFGFLNNGNNDNNNNRLSFNELQQRRQQQQQARDQAKKVGAGLAMDPREGIASIASAEEVGDYFQYVIDQKVSLPRQKSALLPIVNQNVEGTKVSIFNESVQAKFPLLGLKFKNTSGQPLMQGPITVYEGGTYAGDTRIHDLQPNEERLVSYAVDLGTEVKAEGKGAPDQLIGVKVVKGVVHSTHKLRTTKTYLVKNRSGQDRVMLIEHPIRESWKLVTPEKASEQSRDVYRFQLPVVAGKSAQLEVVEERTGVDQLALTAGDDNTLRVFLRSTVTSPKVKEGLQKAIDLRAKVAETQRDRANLEKQLKAITDDQVRLRANLDKVPPASASYKRYVEKFDTQETQIEKLQDQIAKKQESELLQQKELEDYVAGLSVE